MKKRLRVCLLMILAVLIISGCSSTSASKEKDYTKVIDSALKANQKLVKEYDWEKEDLFERKQSNIMIWEDENNYYVYFRKNKSNKVYGDNISPVYEENNVELVSDDENMR